MVCLCFVFCKQSDESIKYKKFVICAICIYVGLSLLGIIQTNGLYCAIITEQIPFLTNDVVYAITGFSLGTCLSGIKGLEFSLCNWDKYFVMRFILIIYLSYNVIIRSQMFELIYYIFTFCVIIFFDKRIEIDRFMLRILNQLSECTYAIYILQFPCFYYLEKYVFVRFIDTDDNISIVFVILNLQACIIFSIIAHYVIEKPIIKYYNRRFSK